MPNTHKTRIDSAEPLLAGTLALMTFYADKPSLAAMQKIGRNLQTLQQHPQLGTELSVVCRFAASWSALQ